MEPGLCFRFLLACFFLSGLAWLLYEIAWILEISPVFGTSGLALVMVPAAYRVPTSKRRAQKGL